MLENVFLSVCLIVSLAALTADKITEYADFVSFGTKDLTQTTFGISRDDAETHKDDDDTHKTAGSDS